jgi:hypothetical protein
VTVPIGGAGICRALAMGLFGEFENLGIAIGPVVGGLVWSAALWFVVR